MTKEEVIANIIEIDLRTSLLPNTILSSDAIDKLIKQVQNNVLYIYNLTDKELVDFNNAFEHWKKHE